MNDEFELGLELDGDPVLEEPKAAKLAKAAKAPRISAKKQAMLDAVMSASEEDIEDMPAPVGAIVLDADGKRKSRSIRIIIDEVSGVKENYEVVGVNGIVYQIKRGVPIDVPPEVVHALELAQMTHIEQKFNKMTGEHDEVERSFSAIPWRRV